MDIKDLRQAAIDFLDNGGGTNAAGESCDYCKGKRDPNSSDHPDKAIISLKHDRETSYEKYIDVQNELLQLIMILREREAQGLIQSISRCDNVYECRREERINLARMKNLMSVLRPLRIYSQ